MSLRTDLTYNFIFLQKTFFKVQPTSWASPNTPFVSLVFFFFLVIGFILSFFDQNPLLFDEIFMLFFIFHRTDISQRLSGTPDGSFSIRPSERSKGEWTLTVR